jgi:hypothetical protein
MRDECTDIFSQKSEGKCLGILGIDGKVIRKLISKNGI